MELSGLRHNNEDHLPDLPKCIFENWLAASKSFQPKNTYNFHRKSPIFTLLGASNSTEAPYLLIKLLKL